MRILKTVHVARETVRKIKGAGKTIGLVATMGALHQGHASLIRQARRENEVLVVSIFVNPRQFGPQEDFKRYPRPLRKDLSLCNRLGVDYVFYPAAGDMFPQGFKTQVCVSRLSDRLCGISRPSHFSAVATVVIKLFNIIQPDISYFGKKDFQQAVILRQMTDDLNFTTKIKMLPIIRDGTGLALSSRNSLLSPQEKADAAVLYRSLRLAKDLAMKGQKDASKIIRFIFRQIKAKDNARIDYVCVVDSSTLEPKKKIRGNCLIALAVRIGKTRLIDNIQIP